MMKMIAFELDKTVIKNKGILLTLLAVLIKLITLGAEAHAINPFTYENRAQYLPIVNAFSGKITQDVSTAIEKQYTAVTEAQVNMTALRQKYNSGEIAEAEYITQSRALEKLVNVKDLFLTFYSQYTYAQEKPEERYLLYDDGWNGLLAQERFDWGFVLLTIVLSASVFGREYESDMRSILIATKKGDTRLIAAKFVSIFATVVICSLIASLVEYLFFSLKFGLPHGDYPLQSLYYFKDSAFHLTLQQTYLYISAYRMLGLLMLAVVTMFISVLTQKTIVTLSASLMYVVLPYALPVEASTKYLLPSPLGFILAQGFFRGTQMGEAYQANEVLFNAISQGLQIQLVIGWLVVAGVMLLMIARQFLAARPFLHFRKRRLALPFILFILAGMTGCSAPMDSSQRLDKAYNMGSDWRFTVVKDEMVTLYPSFLMENMQTHEINDVIRDPFIDTDTSDNTVSSIFSRNGKLDYLVKTEDELKIVELDLSTYKASILYDEYTPKNPALLNSDLEVHRWGIGKAGIFFFIDGDNIYMQAFSNLRKVNPVTGSDETILKNVYSGHMAFDGENIYYTNTMYEISVYNLASGENKPIPNIRADALYIRGNKIYYRNVDEDGIIYVYDTETQHTKAVIPNRAYFFASDDNYLYYTNQEDQNYLYRANLKTGVSELVVPLGGSNIQIMDGYPFVYYSVYGKDFEPEYYRIDKQTLSYEKIEYPTSE